MGNTERAFNDVEKAIDFLINGYISAEWDNARPSIKLQLSDAQQVLGDIVIAVSQLDSAQQEGRIASSLR